jgi:23S rRNA (uridine2552-2'-O)-methyltransferase
MKRTKTSKAWMNQHVHDPYVQQAKQHGYRARSAYKLLELDAKDHLLKPGMRVVDLGSAPGGWSQVAAQKVGESGKVFALDILEMTGMPGVTFIQGDFTEDTVLAELNTTLAGQAVDLVISDMAPNISGIALSDQAKSYYLAELALDFAVNHLKPGGCLLVKVFQGGDFDTYLKSLRERFKQVEIRKPDASRNHSKEVYLVGKDMNI